QRPEPAGHPALVSRARRDPSRSRSRPARRSPLRRLRFESARALPALIRGTDSCPPTKDEGRRARSSTFVLRPHVRPSSVAIPPAVGYSTGEQAKARVLAGATTAGAQRSFTMASSVRQLHDLGQSVWLD